MLIVNGFSHSTPPFVIPTDIAGCAIWMAADLIVGLSNGDPVSTWEDFSGNNNDATQASPSNRPVYNTAVLNGKPVLTFTALNLSVLQTSGAAPILNQPYTAFVVVKVTGLPYECILDGVTVATGIVSSNLDNTGYEVYAGGGLADVAATPSNWNYLGIIFNGASSNLYINGSSNSISTSGGGISGITIGSRGNGGYPLDGQIAEVIYYDSALSGADISKVNTYLATKYSL